MSSSSFNFDGEGNLIQRLEKRVARAYQIKDDIEQRLALRQANAAYEAARKYPPTDDGA